MLLGVHVWIRTIVVTNTFTWHSAQAMLEYVVVTFVWILARLLGKFYMFRQYLLLFQSSMHLIWRSLMCALWYSLLLANYEALGHRLGRVKHSILTELVMQWGKLLHIICTDVSVEHAKRVMAITLLWSGWYQRFMPTRFSLNLAFFKAVVRQVFFRKLSLMRQ